MVSLLAGYEPGEPPGDGHVQVYQGVVGGTERGTGEDLQPPTWSVEVRAETKFSQSLLGPSLLLV